jgi:CDP-paratose 2-epimerase
VAWFAIAHALGKQVKIYGDGKQTRDVLFIDDLTSAYLLAYEHRERVAGQVYNIGGGPRNQLSLLELLDLLKRLRGRAPTYAFADWRPGDQKVFVADIRKARQDFDWEPVCSSETGVGNLVVWIDTNLALFESLES